MSFSDEYLRLHDLDGVMGDFGLSRPLAIRKGAVLAGKLPEQSLCPPDAPGPPTTKSVEQTPAVIPLSSIESELEYLIAEMSRVAQVELAAQKYPRQLWRAENYKSLVKRIHLIEARLAKQDRIPDNVRQIAERLKDILWQPPFFRIFQIPKPPQTPEPSALTVAIITHERIAARNRWTRNSPSGPSQSETAEPAAGEATTPAN